MGRCAKENWSDCPINQTTMVSAVVMGSIQRDNCSNFPIDYISIFQLGFLHNRCGFLVCLLLQCIFDVVVVTLTFTSISGHFPLMIMIYCKLCCSTDSKRQVKLLSELRGVSWAFHFLLDCLVQSMLK